MHATDPSTPGPGAPDPNALRFPASWRDRRVVLAHDWLTGMRGGENCLEILCNGFPQASLLTLLCHAPSISPAILAHTRRTSFLQGIPGIERHYRHWLPLFPAAVAGLRCPPADLLLSTSHCVAKAVRPPPGCVHVSYCFTPMRYAWLFFEEYFGTQPLRRFAVAPLLAALRRWDRATAVRVHRFVAISRHVQDRIRRFYGREADVVYPPVDTVFYTPDASPREDFDLLVSALVPYKRVDLAVRAYSASQRPLRVVGVGGDLARLRALAGPTVHFLEWQPRTEIRRLYRTCRFLLFPGEEDFGIVPVEAQACGTPVIAFARGGATETVQDGVTGRFFPVQTEEALLAAVERAAHTPWDRDVIRAHALRFGMQAFVDGLAAAIERARERGPVVW